MKYKLSLISRFILGMLIAFILGGLIGFFSTKKDCSYGECLVQVCEEEGEEIHDPRTGQVGNMCVMYGTEIYPAKEYIRKESIKYGFISAFGLGIILGLIFIERFKKNNLSIKEDAIEGQARLF